MWDEFLKALSCKNCLADVEEPEPHQIKILDELKTEDPLYNIEHPYKPNISIYEKNFKSPNKYYNHNKNINNSNNINKLNNGAEKNE